MRWFKPSLRNSLYGLLGHGEPSASVLDCRIEDIREAMLDLLPEDEARHFPQVTRKIRYASDVHALWYLRGDLMAVLAGLHGEVEARRQVATISAMFRGLLPRSVVARPRFLAG